MTPKDLSIVTINPVNIDEFCVKGNILELDSIMSNSGKVSLTFATASHQPEVTWFCRIVRGVPHTVKYSWCAYRVFTRVSANGDREICTFIASPAMEWDTTEYITYALHNLVYYCKSFRTGESVELGDDDTTVVAPVLKKAKTATKKVPSTKSDTISTTLDDLLYKKTMELLDYLESCGVHGLEVPLIKEKTPEAKMKNYFQLLQLKDWVDSRDGYVYEAKRISWQD